MLRHAQRIPVALILLSAAMAAPTPAAWSAEQPQTLAPLGVASLLARSGLDLDTLAVAGMNSAQLGDALADLSTRCPGDFSILLTLDAEISRLRDEIAALEAIVRTGQSQLHQATALQAARDRLDAARRERAELLQGVREVATERLDGRSQATIQVVMDNRRWELPTEVLVVERGEPEWLELAAAWHAVHAAEHLGSAPAPAYLSVVEQARMQPSAIEAAQRLALLKPQLDAVLDAFLE